MHAIMSIQSIFFPIYILDSEISMVIAAVEDHRKPQLCSTKGKFSLLIKKYNYCSKHFNMTSLILELMNNIRCE